MCFVLCNFFYTNLKFIYILITKLYFLQEESTDDQCILIEDDMDQFVMEEEEKDKAEKKKSSENQDSEIIPDIDQFRNEDVEFITESSENLTQPSNQDHEVIEISDHESESASKKNEVDTEAVSEDELPTETATKVSFFLDYFCQTICYVHALHPLKKIIISKPMQLNPFHLFSI